MGERGRTRDLYDIVTLVRRSDSRPDAGSDSSAYTRANASAYRAVC